VIVKYIALVSLSRYINIITLSQINMDLSSYMEETTLDMRNLSFVQDDENSSDFIQAQAQQQQPANLFMPQRHQNEQQQVVDVNNNNMEFNAEELAAIQEINELFESAPFFDEASFQQYQNENADQNLNYLEDQHFSSEASFDDESIYMDESQMYTEFEDLDSNNLMMLTTEDEEEGAFEVDDDDESFHRVPSTSSVVSARYAQFPQPWFNITWLWLPDLLVII